MKNMTLENIAAACGGRLFWGKEGQEAVLKNKEAACVVLDSRKIQEGGIFIASCGEKADGHNFIGDVFQKGALGVICEKTPRQVKENGKGSEEDWGPYILVENSLQALKDIAEFYRKQLSIPVIGITGSVGKTSTKEMIAGVLAQKYSVLKTEGNFNNEIGLPLTLLRIRDEHEAAVVEMGISDFGEMHRLSKMARPDICVITNIGQCHLENLKSREGILQAKTEIFDFMPWEGHVCVNGNDDMLATLDRVKGRKVHFFGVRNEGCECFDSDFEVCADEIENKGLFGSSAVLHKKNQKGQRETLQIQIPLPGFPMVINAAAAALVADILGLDAEQISKGISAVEAVGGRSHIIRQAGRTIIDDCYNANPVSMKAAIDLLLMAEGRKIAVLGDMFELGSDSQRLHEEVGSYAGKAGVEVIICVGENAEYMYRGALEQKHPEQEIYYFPSREMLLEKLVSILKKEDTILVKASHGMGFVKVVEYLQEQ